MNSDQSFDSSTDIGTSAARPLSTVGKTVFIVIIAGASALAYASFKTYSADRSERRALVEDGTETDADVVLVERRVRGPRRGGPVIELFVSYDPEGPEMVAYATVFPCSEVQYEDTETVRIVYLPGDPEAVLLAGCEASIDSWIPPVVGALLFALAIYLLWQLVRQWR